MTLKDIENIDRDFLIPKEIAGILGVRPYAINVQVKYDISHGVNSFGFPVMLIGTRVKIPKLPFIKFMREGLIEEE